MSDHEEPVGMSHMDSDTAAKNGKQSYLLGVVGVALLVAAGWGVSSVRSAAIDAMEHANKLDTRMTVSESLRESDRQRFEDFKADIRAKLDEIAKAQEQQGRKIDRLLEGRGERR